MYILNAFSLAMVPEYPAQLAVTELSCEQARTLVQGTEVQSAVGHAETAAILSDLLGIAVATNRITVHLQRGQWALVGQYDGPRLPEGATRLPPNARVRWLRVAVL